MPNRSLGLLSFSITISILVLVWTLDAASAARTIAAVGELPLAETTAVHELRTNNAGISFELRTPRVELDGNGGLSTAGLPTRLQQPGAPDLPYYSTLIALPPQADVVAVRIAESDVSPVLNGRVQPAKGTAPISTSARSARGEAHETTDVPFLIPPRQIRVADPALYGRDVLYPESIYNLSEPIYYRDLRLVELRLYPIRFNPGRGTIHQVGTLQVQLTFEDAPAQELHRAPSHEDSYVHGLSDHVLNFEQATRWRSLPAGLGQLESVRLPVGLESFKISVNRDGVYEIWGSDLAAAGMVISQVNPSRVQMMNRGITVATQFVGDSDNQLESDERFRFFGWAFDGPRAEKQFVSDNIFWLWESGTATHMLTGTNEALSGHTVVTQFLSTVTREPENHFFGTWTRWDGFPNEPDAWFWDYIRKGPGTLTRTYDITLPHPATNGSDATVLAELNSKTDLQPGSSPHLVNVFLNDGPSFGSKSWYGKANVNVIHSVPLTQLRQGVNEVDIAYATGTVDQLYLNRISVTYMRQLVASNDQLLFTDVELGAREYHVSGFATGDAGQAIILDVTNPRSPVQIPLTSSHVTSGTGGFNYSFGTSQPVGSGRYLFTTADNIITANQISRYVAPSLEPDSDRADWLAITHKDFYTEAGRLADHRASSAYGGLETYIVDVADVINQFGFGLALPQAIRDYLAHALGNWSLPPTYVLLVGDATQNPRHLNCPLSSEQPRGGCTTWDQDEPTYVLTDLVFVDRFQGMIPSDHTFVMLSGNDLLPDMSIGRIAAQSATEAAAAIDKIIEYEQNQRTPAAWQENILFVADNADAGGDFCRANEITGDLLPENFNQTHLCLDASGAPTSTSVLTPLMAAAINDEGLTLMNYRGHGSVGSWAKEFILTTDDTDFWDNPGKPVVILSADCLDGYFAWPGRPSLGEVFLELKDAGTAAHWSSTGLGFTGEHSVLHRAFYNALFDLGMSRMGNAINYSKVNYHTLGYHESELYSFTLQGDPAMRLAWPKKLFLPMISNN